MQIICSMLSFAFRRLQRRHNMSTKSLNQDVLKNRLILSFKMLCGSYQYIVEIILSTVLTSIFKFKV